jgi:hypothetical protein
VDLTSRSLTLGILLLVFGCGAREENRPTAAVAVAPAAAAPASDESPPEEYLRLHLALLSPSDPTWPATMERLHAVGDGFTLVQLDIVAARDLDADQRVLVDNLRAAVHAREPAETAEALPARILPRLERAALADLKCDPLEVSLTPWVLASIQAHANDSRVRAELERIRDNYRPSTEVRTMFATLSDRVVAYATQLLAGVEPAITR